MSGVLPSCAQGDGDVHVAWLAGEDIAYGRIDGPSSATDTGTCSSTACRWTD
jgi:hypothetical protein